MWTTELENVATSCFKALEGSNYGVRVSVAKLLGTVMATALMPKQAAGRLKDRFSLVAELISFYLCVNVCFPSHAPECEAGHSGGGAGADGHGLSAWRFWLPEKWWGDVERGRLCQQGSAGGRHAGEAISCSSDPPPTPRLSDAKAFSPFPQAYVVFVTTLGGQWLERNFATFLSHVLDLVSHPRATQTHVEAVYSRRCVSFMLRATLGGLLGEKAQIAAGKEICQAIGKQMRAVGKEDGGEISRFKALQSKYSSIVIALTQPSFLHGLSLCSI